MLLKILSAKLQMLDHDIHTFDNKHIETIIKRDHPKISLPPMLIKGASIGKNIATIEITYCSIAFVGTIFIIIPFAVPSSPIIPKIKAAIFANIPKKVFGKFLKAFFAFILTLYQRVLCSKIISKTQPGVQMVASTSLKRGTTSFRLNISSFIMKT